MPRNRYTRSVRKQEAMEHAQREKSLSALIRELPDNQPTPETPQPEPSPSDKAKDRRRIRREQKR